MKVKREGRKTGKCKKEERGKKVGEEKRRERQRAEEREEKRNSANQDESPKEILGNELVCAADITSLWYESRNNHISTVKIDITSHILHIATAACNSHLNKISPASTSMAAAN